ncbi:MAG: B12-binding domain-containing radical SAM protein [Tissierellia bacterium]|nr:B12-binding domain-containing radical SAM protein [Tissierellia bacterium]
MNVILSTLNSKYIHSNLAIRYLKEYVRDIVEVELAEFTINQNLDEISGELFKMNPDLIGFSTYIWNVNEILEIIERLKIVNPDLKIILGGPEVSYDSYELLLNNPGIDFVIAGEGEETYKELIQGRPLEEIKGLAFRRGEKIKVNIPRPLIKDINSIPSPYINIGDEYRNKIVYYETSRGCPFNCKFCLSSTIRGVRYMNIERVKEDIDSLIDAGVKQVKFVDRTFNSNKKFSKAVMEHIISRDPKEVNFHLELTAHLIDDEQLEFLEDIKEGLFQFEIGVQSTNPQTIEAIGRTTDIEYLKKVSSKIKSFKNIHQHLDLIAGLPYENYNSFSKSFNSIYEIRPEKIQLGFLKLLKGSEIRQMSEKYGYKFLDKPPYEVLENFYISYGELLKLKHIENIVEKYYNEAYFENSLDFIIKNNFHSAFLFYEDFADYWDKKDLFKVSHKRNTLYTILQDYFLYKDLPDFELFSDILRFDYLSNNDNKGIPKEIESKKQIGNKDMHKLLKDKNLLDDILESEKDTATKKLLLKTSISCFSYDILEVIKSDFRKTEKIERVILFYYKNGVINRSSTYDVTDYLRRINNIYDK